MLYEQAILITSSFIQAQNIKNPPKITPLSMISILKDFLKADETALRFDLFALNQVSIFKLLIIYNVPCVMRQFWNSQAGFGNISHYHGLKDERMLTHFFKKAYCGPSSQNSNGLCRTIPPGL
jgi:hypothetical protein